MRVYSPPEKGHMHMSSHFCHRLRCVASIALRGLLAIACAPAVSTSPTHAGESNIDEWFAPGVGLIKVGATTELQSYSIP